MGGEESVMAVSGESPLPKADLWFAASFDVLEKIDEVVLASELAESTPCSMSPDSAVGCDKPARLEPDRPLTSFGALNGAGETRGCEYSSSSRLRFREAGELPPSTSSTGDMVSRRGLYQGEM